jgi:O-antigen ligase
MIRVAALWAVTFGLVAYSRKDWYAALCGLVLMMAVIEHPDVPKTMFGIQGLNFWNVLLVAVVAAWIPARRREGLTWDMPTGVQATLVLYLGVVVVAFARMFGDRSYLDDPTTLSLTSEYLINTVKWVVPALLLFDGCRSERRFIMALASILGVYLLLGAYVIKWMPLGLLTDGDELQRRALKIIVNEIGLHRVTMSMMLAGASWAIFSARVLVPTRWGRLAVFGAAGTVVLAQALTGGRMGYVTWGVIGVLLLSIRGRGYLLLAPVVVAAIAILVPAARERLMQGFTPETSIYAQAAAAGSGQRLTDSGVDVDTVTAGRTLIWPYVMDKIAERPIEGYGMLAMQRTGLTYMLDTRLGEGFAHPHNAYLEAMFDNGIVGLLIVVPFHLYVLWLALRLYADGSSPIAMAAGGAGAALVLALLVAGFGSQSFYPREASVGMWCAMGLVLRVWVQRRGLATTTAQHAAPPAAVPLVPRWPSAAAAPAPAPRPLAPAREATAAAPVTDWTRWHPA